MNYETKDGGKEHYNDIIAQYNALYNDCFEDVSKAANEGALGAADIAERSCSVTEHSAQMLEFVRESGNMADALKMKVERFTISQAES